MVTTTAALDEEITMGSLDARVVLITGGALGEGRVRPVRDQGQRRMPDRRQITHDPHPGHLRAVCPGGLYPDPRTGGGAHEGNESTRYPVHRTVRNAGRQNVLRLRRSPLHQR